MPYFDHLKNVQKSLRMLARVSYLTHVSRQENKVSDLTHMDKYRRWFSPLIYFALLLTAACIWYVVNLAWAAYSAPDCATKSYTYAQREQWQQDIKNDPFLKRVWPQESINFHLRYWGSSSVETLNFCLPGRTSGKPILIWIGLYGGYVLFTFLALIAVWVTTNFYGSTQRWLLAHLWQSSIMYLLGFLMLIAAVTGNYAPIVFVIGVVTAGAVILNFLFVVVRHAIARRSGRKAQNN